MNCKTHFQNDAEQQEVEEERSWRWWVQGDEGVLQDVVKREEEGEEVVDPLEGGGKGT